MCTPSAPPAPDVKAAAAATASGNQNAALAAQTGNMTNQVGPQQYSYNAETSEYTPTGTYSGVIYSNPAKPDKFGNMPFDQSTLTPEQKATYNATGKLPDKFNVTYLPQQWNQTQTLGANDQQLFNQSQATQLGLSNMALAGLDKVRTAINQDVSPYIQIQGAPESTAGQFTRGIDSGFTGGDLNTQGLQASINNSGQIQKNLGNVGLPLYSANANGLAQLNSGANGLANTSIENNANKINTSAQTVLDNNGNLIQLNSGANQQAFGLGRGQNNANQIQTNLGIDPQLLNQQTQNALYQANTQYLDPQFNQQQAKLENQLANQGITRGSEAYNNAMLNFNNQKQQAYESARNNAIAGSTAAAQGMFGMGLQGAQFGNTALGQQFGQNVTAQQLANSAAGQNNANAQTNQQLYNAALGQQFGQGLQAADFGNRAIAQNNAALGQQFNQNLQAGQFSNQAIAQNNANALANQQAYNQAISQNNTNALANAQFGNTAQQQAYNQELGYGNFANQAQQQQYNQNLSDMQAQNQAVTQRFGMDLSNQQQLNNAQQQSFNAGLANANLNNQALTQLYNQNLQNAQINNAASNQQLAQNQAIQQNPLNILQALRTGAQLNTANLPTVGVSQPGQLANWSGPDMLGATQAQMQYNQGIYNAQAAANSQMMGSLIGAGGMLGAAAIKSDKRLKKNIVKLGIHKTLGIGLYTWDYLWGEKGAGVMAQELQEVMPKAVITMPDGYLAVNYSMLGA